jgi:hypothetical protein
MTYLVLLAMILSRAVVAMIASLEKTAMTY